MMSRVPVFSNQALCALADSRKNQILKALAHGKHIISEKPIAMLPEDEWELVKAVGESDRLATVNLYLRSSWYHHQLKQFIDEGELGELAIIRICHMTPGLSPGEGHEYEGPSFHDCGMHYVDIARWYADSEYKTGHAQAIRMWDYKDPWWLQCHGTFENGIVYDITQGFVYGQLALDQTHNSYTELIGSKGFVRMTHDFKTAVVEMHGEHITQRIEKRIHTVKQQEEEERDYMTFEMRIRQERAEASAEGKAEAKSEMIVSMLKEHMHINIIERVSGWTGEKIRALAQANGLAVE